METTEGLVRKEEMRAGQLAESPTLYLCQHFAFNCQSIEPRPFLSSKTSLSLSLISFILQFLSFTLPVEKSLYWVLDTAVDQRLNSYLNSIITIWLLGSTKLTKKQKHHYQS